MKHNREKIKALPKSIIGKFKSIIGASLPPKQIHVQGSVDPGNLGLPGQRSEGTQSYVYYI